MCHRMGIQSVLIQIFAFHFNYLLGRLIVLSNTGLDASVISFEHLLDVHAWEWPHTNLSFLLVSPV